MSAAAPIPEAPHRRHEVRAEEDVGALRRSVADLAARCPGVRAGDAALVATELAANLLRHATSGGYVLFREASGGIELLAVDRGPGMRWTGAAAASAGVGADRRPAVGASPLPESGAAPSGPVAPRWRPGSGAAGRSPGLGVGLASVQHLATAFDLYSAQPGGTVVLARLATGATDGGWCRWGAVDVPYPGEVESGDGWAVHLHADGSLSALVVDGLGHGPGAAEAARAALRAFAARPPGDLEAFIRSAHEAMRGSRGGVLGACVIEPSRGELRYAGVGNVAGRLLRGGQSHGLLSREGSVGTQLPPPHAHVTRYPWEPGATLVLASDGLRSRWDPRECPGLLAHDPAVVAAALERDFGRPADDVTVLVVGDLRSRGRDGA